MIAGEARRLYVIDVCGTLVHDDTTLGLLNYHFSMTPQRWFRKHIMNVLTARLSPFRLPIMIVEKVTGRHILKHVLVRLLRGDNETELLRSGKVYADYLLAKRRVPQVWEQIEKAQRGKDILLASASLEPVVRSLAEIMGARYVSSTLEVINGRLTGRYLEDLTGKKVDAVSIKFGPEVLEQPFIAISDNVSDRCLIQMAKVAFVVLHKESHRRRWDNIDATFLSVAN